jgi:hypothetical protein
VFDNALASNQIGSIYQERLSSILEAIDRMRQALYRYIMASSAIHIEGSKVVASPHSLRRRRTPTKVINPLRHCISAGKCAFDEDMTMASRDL